MSPTSTVNRGTKAPSCFLALPWWVPDVAPIGVQALFTESQIQKTIHESSLVRGIIATHLQSRINQMHPHSLYKSQSKNETKRLHQHEHSKCASQIYVIFLFWYIWAQMQFQRQKINNLQIKFRQPHGPNWVTWTGWRLRLFLSKGRQLLFFCPLIFAKSDLLGIQMNRKQSRISCTFSYF